MSRTGPPAPDPLYTFRPHSGEITSVKYVSLSEEESGIVSGTCSGFIHLWSLASKRPLWSEAVGSSILLLDTCKVRGQARLVSQTRSNTIDVWDYNVKKRVFSFKIADPGFCQFATFCNSLESCVATPSQELSSKINIYDLSSGRIKDTYTTKDSKPRGMCMCINSLCNNSSGVCYIVAGYEDGTVVLWDERNPRTELHTCQLFSDPVMCLGVDDGKRGTAGSVGTIIQSFTISLEKGMLEKDFQVQVKNPGISDIAVRHDQKLFATGGWDGRIRIFSWMKGKPLAVINYHSHSINCIAFANRSQKNILLCGSKDELISVWKLF